jgi:hypothetical protein
MILFVIGFALGVLGTYLVDAHVCKEFRKLDETP